MSSFSLTRPGKLCVYAGWSDSGSEFYFKFVIDADVKAVPCEDIIVSDENFLDISLVIIA